MKLFVITEVRDTLIKQSWHHFTTSCGYNISTGVGMWTKILRQSHMWFLVFLVPNSNFVIHSVLSFRAILPSGAKDTDSASHTWTNTFLELNGIPHCFVSSRLYRLKIWFTTRKPLPHVSGFATGTSFAAKSTEVLSGRSERVFFVTMLQYCTCVAKRGWGNVTQRITKKNVSLHYS